MTSAERMDPRVQNETLFREVNERIVSIDGADDGVISASTARTRASKRSP
jgi:hypothetical protein